MQTYRACYRSEIGPIEIFGRQKGILTITFAESAFRSERDLPPTITECLRQLAEYFNGQCQKFNLPLLWQGTDFQKAVWRQLQNIPFGQTTSYGDVARAIGRPRAFRAVGNANNKNPIPLIVPCHRVIGSNGQLVGYGSGLWRKQWLLDHEKRFQ